jgi:UDP-3-O-acyl-N-acetylglucosamine deacetylase
MSDKQRTIEKPVTIKGKGLHTGLQVELTFKPAQKTTDTNFNALI